MLYKFHILTNVKYYGVFCMASSNIFTQHGNSKCLGFSTCSLHTCLFSTPTHTLPFIHTPHTYTWYFQCLFWLQLLPAHPKKKVLELNKFKMKERHLSYIYFMTLFSIKTTWLQTIFPKGQFLNRSTAQCVHWTVGFPCSKKSPVVATGECSCYRGITIANGE